MHSSAKPTVTKTPLGEPDAFQRALVDWFREDGKTYPWRETHDPYAIVVSELMLQQTQIATVLERDYYGRWMRQFPDVHALAEASEDEILKAWEGLGYYRRARNLHKLAQVVCEEHGGVLPDTLEGVLALPGIGRYTAGAVLSFAHNLPVGLVDGNVYRVFARLFDYQEVVDSTAGQKQMWSWAEALVSEKEARLYNSALMELGQTICSQKAPQCGECPVRSFCKTREPESLPKKKPRRKTVFQDEHVLFLLEKEALHLVQEEGKRREGLWKLPTCPESQIESLQLIYKAKYSITHHRVTLHVYDGNVAGANTTAIPVSEVASLAMPSPYRKAVDRLLEDSDGFHLRND